MTLPTTTDEFFLNHRYALSVNYDVVMYDISVGQYRLATPLIEAEGQEVCGYCGHRLSVHLRTTHVMHTTVRCYLCGTPCVLWQHIGSDVPSDSLISYESEEVNG